MSGLRDELNEMAEGSGGAGGRWCRAPPSRSPRSGRRRVPDRLGADRGGIAARQAILNGVHAADPAQRAVAARARLEDLEGVPAPVMFLSNHASHLDATMIMSTLPDRWQARTAVGAARDYFFDVWWRQAFTALVYGGVPDRRGRGAAGRGRQGARAGERGLEPRRVPRGDAVPGRARAAVPPRRGAAVHRVRRAAVPIAILGRVPGDAEGPELAAGRAGRPSRCGSARRSAPSDGETTRTLSLRMQQAVAELHDEDRTTWWESLHRARSGETPVAGRPAGPRVAAAVGGHAAACRAGRARGPGSAVPRTGGEERRGTLVEEAIRQFGREGYKGASLDSIATAVGVRKQTLLYYFPTKDALLEACLAAAGERLGPRSRRRSRAGDLLGTSARP